MVQRCQGTSTYLRANCLGFPVHTGIQIQSRFGRSRIRALAIRMSDICFFFSNRQNIPDEVCVFPHLLSFGLVVKHICKLAVCTYLWWHYIAIFSMRRSAPMICICKLVVCTYLWWRYIVISSIQGTFVVGGKCSHDLR